MKAVPPEAAGLTMAIGFLMCVVGVLLTALAKAAR